jgi:hypothetical protein
MAGTEVAKSSGALAEVLKASGGYTGFEDFSQSDLSQNYLGIESMKMVNGKTMNGHEPGVFFSSVTGKPYGKEINAIFLKHLRGYSLWDAKDKFVKRISADEFRAKYQKEYNIEDGFKLGKIVDGKRVGYALESRVYAMMIADKLEDGIFFLTLKTTNLKHVRKINTRLMEKKNSDGSQAPIYAGVWKLGTDTTCTDDYGGHVEIGKGSKPALSFVRWTNEKELLEIGKALEMVQSIDDGAGSEEIPF